MITKDMIGEKLLNDMRQAALHAYPNEACGLLVNTCANKYELILCRNVSEEPENFFVMDADDQVAAEQMGQVVAVWHSHTDGDNQASEADLAGCEASEIPWFIINISKNYNPEIEAEFRFSDINVIEPSGFEMPYEGRPYAFGVFDCWLLCRDYLKREFGIEMGVCLDLHIPSWWDKGMNILHENYESQGLVRLPVGTPPQRGDIFFMQMGSKMSDHCAVYIGDGMILHHQIDRLSTKAIYGGMYEKHTTHHLRHKNLMEGISNE
ncbi:C40 family peptidase [Photorhabdus asymbiotica]|uniref:C40 family peptidase n=1 Tax=Photorhabdus asymbiotica TaxID=291112 RepID=UPI003DA78A0D